MPTNQRYLKETSWSAVREEFRTLAPDIFEAMDQVEQDDEYRLYEAAYPYGDVIVSTDGILQLPNEAGELVPINHKSISKKIKEDLGYNWNSLPLGFLCEGQFHVFTEKSSGDTDNMYAYNRGGMLSTRIVLDDLQSFHTQVLWRAASGARSPVYLAGLSYGQHYNRLKDAYGLRLKKPDHPSQHWELCKELANSPNFKTPWVTRIIFLSKKWRPEKSRNDLQRFRHVLLERSWMASSYDRHLLILNKIWDGVLSSLRHKLIRDYHKAFARYLIEAALGVTLVSKLYAFDNSPGPFNEITDIILNEYRLDKHAPLLFIQGHHNPDIDDISYISMAMPPNNLQRVRRDKNDSTIINQRLIKFIIDHVKEKLIGEKTVFAGSLFYKLKGIEFDFFNSKSDRFGEILLTNELFPASKIKKTFPKHPNNQDIFSTHEFIRAGIRIRRGKNKK